VAPHHVRWLPPVQLIIAALGEQHAELDALVAGYDDAAWARPSRCEGWNVGDVVLHLWHSDQLALASVRGELAPAMPSRLGEVDDLAGERVAADRGAPGAEVHARWKATAEELRRALGACDPSARLQWVAGDLAARTLATTRLAECWIHTNDIADTEPADRLVHVARLAHRTLPYAFRQAGVALSGAVRFDLVAPSGAAWTFGDPDAPTVIAGPGVDLCRVASRRVAPEDTDLVGTGPDAARVLELVRTWA
jgi:uncharacterized protein (TIGR03084 family)